MKTAEPFAALFNKRESHIKPGLERVYAALAELGIEQKSQTKTILVGGTNGKGSTCGMLYRLCTAAGIRCGIFTSPHLQSFSERIQTNFAVIDDAILKRELAALQAALSPELYDSLSFFEITTLLALSVFREYRTEVNIMEVGLGGRWDATNALSPDVSCIVSVSRDHEQWLGHDLKGIALEKLGIARPGKPLFWGEDHSDLSFFAKDYCQEGEIPFLSRQHFYITDDLVHLALPGQAPRTIPLPQDLRDHPQPIYRRNWALALAAFHALVPKTEKSSTSELHERLPASLRCRNQRLKLLKPDGQEQEAIIDICHNPGATQEFLASLPLRAEQKKYPALISFLADKDVNTLLDLLRQKCEPIVLFKNRHERCFQAEQLAERHRDLDLYPNLQTAVNSLLLLETTPGPWIICGSLLGVGEVLDFFAVENQMDTRAELLGKIHGT